MTLLCVPILVRDLQSALADANAAKTAGADIVEFRIDDFFDPSVVEADPDRREREISRMVSKSPLPCIVTCRASSEGGGYSGSDDDRMALYERLAASGAKNASPPRYLDIEFASLANEAVRARIAKLAVVDGENASGLILSAHDFQGRPSDLTRRVLAMRTDGFASVLKIAYRARSLRDNLELFEMLRESDRPMIALGMGEFGLMSRVLAPKFGGFLTFASLRPETVTAPGQPTVSDLLDLYRFRSIRRATRVFGVVGWPVAHSMSPLVHNAVFAEHKFDGVYLPLPVPAPDQQNPGGAEAAFASFKATLGALIDDPSLDFAGASVTLPHKENLVRFALERLKAEPGVWSLDAVSLATGSANSLLVERDGSRVQRARVFNTDVPAAVSPLRSALAGLETKTVFVLGSGGVARALAFGLAHAGANVTVFNRNVARAEDAVAAISKHLQGRGNLRFAAIGTLADSPIADAYVQCTPVGMAGGPEPTGNLVPIEKLLQVDTSRRNTRAASVVLDTVYNPVQTPLIRAAKSAGWGTIDGVTMFIEQAALQSEAWTGKSAPRQLMDRLVRSKLNQPPE
ncbi:MAG: type I 3-dehydroquinate dehydratase [Phycisphaeraceae bacterium]|nr:type I 3-dehydroquinate dehydratase [Phycisphaeraceae bacterium]